MYSNTYKPKSKYTPKYKSKSKSTEQELQQIKSQLSKLKPELKFNQAATTTAVTTLVVSSPYVQCLNYLSQGTGGVNNRIGDRVRSSFVRLRLNCRATTSLTANSAQQVRVIIAKETSTLGSNLSLSQYLLSTTPGEPNTWDLINVTTRDYKRYTTYYDKTFVVGNYAGNPEEFNIDFNKKLGFITDYPRNNTGTVSDIDTNGLFLIVFTNNTTANAIAFSYSWLYGFYDM